MIDLTHSSRWLFARSGRYPRTVALDPRENQEWRAVLEGKGFVYCSEWYWRFWRFLYPEQLMAHATLQEQGHALGEWIAGTFDVLVEHPPPA